MASRVILEDWSDFLGVNVRTPETQTTLARQLRAWPNGKPAIDAQGASTLSLWKRPDGGAVSPSVYLAPSCAPYSQARLDEARSSIQGFWADRIGDNGQVTGPRLIGVLTDFLVLWNISPMRLGWSPSSFKVKPLEEQTAAMARACHRLRSILHGTRLGAAYENEWAEHGPFILWHPA